MKKILVLTVILLFVGVWDTRNDPGRPMSILGRKHAFRHYQLNNPEKFRLPENLVEISGITFYGGKLDTIFAINDEEGKVYKIKWNAAHLRHVKFGKHADYEDINAANGKFFVLKSNGALYSFSVSDALYSEVDDVSEFKSILPQGEYESISADLSDTLLYVLCKRCEGDFSWNSTTGYIIHVGDSAKLLGSFQIDVTELKAYKGSVKEGFRPSALAKNPISNEWYILSAVNGILVIADPNWKIKQVTALPKEVFNQPEGIAFDAAGNLYIANEGNSISSANILKFKRK